MSGNKLLDTLSAAGLEHYQSLSPEDMMSILGMADPSYDVPDQAPESSPPVKKEQDPDITDKGYDPHIRVGKSLSPEDMMSILGMADPSYDGPDQASESLPPVKKDQVTDITDKRTQKQTKRPSPQGEGFSPRLKAGCSG